MTQIFTHPGQPEMQVEVILASRDATGNAPPLYTIRARYPRVIHAEVMTHRVFGRNARSSRAVPVARMIQEVEERPFVPWHWGRNQKGMQAGEECDEIVILDPHDPDGGWHRDHAWISAANVAVNHARGFMDAGYHKQLVNRLLEPFMWIDVLISSVEWENFLWLRDHKDAEPHLQDLARLLRQAIEAAEPQELKPGEWHLPYVPREEYDEIAGWLWDNATYPGLAPEEWKEATRRISAARCARISYTPFDGCDRDWERDLELYHKLVGSDRIHASPLEHQATPDELLPGATTTWAHPDQHGNLTGWIQYRKLIPGEAGKGTHQCANSP